MSQPNKLDDSTKLTYSVKRASEDTDIPVSTIWMHIKNSHLDTVKVGRRTLIKSDSLRRLVGAA